MNAEQLAAHRANFDRQYGEADAPPTEFVMEIAWQAYQWALADAQRAAPVSEAVATRPGFALVPLRPTQEMEDVFQQEGWQWEDILAAAGTITEQEYDFAAGISDDEAALLRAPDSETKDYYRGWRAGAKFGASVTAPQPVEGQPVAYSGAGENPPVFAWRWKLAIDGFGLQRDDASGNYVDIDDAISVLHAAAAQPVALEPLPSEDTQLLDFLQESSCDLRSIEAPTGGDDSDIHWAVVQHHMAAPHEREIAREYSDDPRAAIRAAIEAAHGITPTSAKGAD